MLKMLLRGVLAAACASILTIGMVVAPLAAQSDQFPDKTVISSCTNWAAITPTDGLVLTRLPKALWVGGAGNINMIGIDAAAGASGVTWAGIPAGTMLSVRPRQINATSTTATLILACY